MQHFDLDGFVSRQSGSDKIGAGRLREPFGGELAIFGVNDVTAGSPHGDPDRRSLDRGGSSNQESAGQLGITIRTVKIHLHNVYQKLAISGRHQLSLYAREKCLL